MRQKQVSSALPPFIVLGGCLTQEIGVFDQDIGDLGHQYGLHQ